MVILCDLTFRANLADDLDLMDSAVLRLIQIRAMILERGY